MPNARSDAVRAPLPEETRPHGRIVAIAGVGVVSAAVLIFEIALSRVFAVTQFYHFAFLTVSIALLGFGASGSVLSAFPALGRGGPRRWSQLALAQAVSTLAAYWVTNALPFDTFAIAWDRRQLLYLAIYYVSLAVPFFFGGLVIAVLLSGIDAPDQLPSHHVYAASLGGSGLGCLVALWGLDALGGERTVALAAVVAALGAVIFAAAMDTDASGSRFPAVITLVVLAPLALSTPSFLAMDLSPYKGLVAALRYPGSEIVSTTWDRGTRVDHVQSEGIRSLAGLSIAYRGPPYPQDGVTFDGDDLSPVPRVRPEDAEFASYLLSSLSFSMRPGGNALVLEPRGGLDVLVALAMGAGHVTAVESLGAAIDVVSATPQNVYADSRVTVIEADARNFLARTGDRFDVIDLALTAPYRPVTSGAYSLAENYLLTVEAFEQYLTRLDRGGVLAVMRWVQQPPSEEVRVIAVAAEAIRRDGRDPESSIVALRGYANVLLLVSPDGFTDSDMAVVNEFAESRRFDIIIGPGVDDTGANRYNVLPVDRYRPLALALVGSGDPDSVYADYQFEIAPPTDDHPFFGHFFKWEQAPEVLDTLGRTWQPFGGAGYFVLLALLGLAVLGSAVLIVAPLAIAPHLRRLRTGRGGLRWWTVAYFGLLGLAFLFVEIPLIQQYILLTGNATSALAVVLFVILVSSGVGSILSRRISWRAAGLVLTVLVVLYAVLLRDAAGMLMGAALPVRMVLGGLLLSPIGFLMGVMFPRGLERLGRRAPELVPWAWGINGTVSVISGAASALLALSVGFSFVMLIGAGAYGLSALLAKRGVVETG